MLAGWTGGSKSVHGENRPTFGVDPLRIEVREGGLIAELLYRFLGLLIYTQDAAGPPPLARLGVAHVSIGTTPRRICADVVRDGAGKENWGRQFDGIEGNRRLESGGGGGGGRWRR